METTSLYGIQEEYRNLMDIIEENDGEITDDVMDELLKNESDFNIKVENYVRMIRHYKGVQDAAKAEIDHIRSKQNIAKNCEERLREYLTAAMKERGLEKVKTDFVSVTRKETRSISDNINLDAVPEEFIKVERSLKKKEIGEAVKGGAKFDWLEYDKKESITIR